MQNRLIRKAIRRRFVVTLKGNEGDFSGVLTDADRVTLVFEQCATVPANFREGTPAEIPGRVFVERTNVAYLQEVS